MMRARRVRATGVGSDEFGTLRRSWIPDPASRWPRDRLRRVRQRPHDRAFDRAAHTTSPAEGWEEYSDDVERTYRALTAPGVTTLVATVGGRVVGAIQVQSDGIIQAHVSMLLIDPDSRGRRLGARLLREGLRRAGGLKLDIRTRTEGYYERLGASRSFGFRLTREDLGLGSSDAD
jgi:ribosomal protein S18 acetylase RimI-like enzyme